MLVRHIALNTGHVQDSRQDEIDLEVTAGLWPIIAEACAGKSAQGVAVPAVDGYSFTARSSGRCITASVYADGPPSGRLCSIAAAGHSHCGALAWRALHALAAVPLATDPAHVPPEPWFAVLMTVASEDDADALTWLGDFARYLAWTYLLERS